MDCRRGLGSVAAGNLSGAMEVKLTRMTIYLANFAPQNWYEKIA
jgi:hypothetical protein